MSTDYTTRSSYSFRLPFGVAEVLESLASDLGLSKTQVVSEAIELLNRQHMDALIAQGFAEMAMENRADAQAAMPAAREVSDEW